MKIYYNSPSFLHARVRSISWSAKRNWRCIYGNVAHGRGQRLHPCAIGRAMAAILEEEEGAIYIFDDGDIFIFFEGALRPIVKKLGKNFQELGFKQYWEPTKAMFTVFDLNVYLQPFIALCQSRWVKNLEQEEMATFPVFYTPAAEQHALQN